MSDAPTTTRSARLMGLLVLVIGSGLLLSGVACYGFSSDVYHRIWHDMVERASGPMWFRFLLQPAMAFIAALHDGIADARLNRPPYFWTVLRSSSGRGRRVHEGLVATSRLFLIAIAMDMIYQWRVLGTFFPGEALLTALLLAVVPYFLLRGPICRIAGRLVVSPSSHGKSADGQG